MKRAIPFIQRILDGADLVLVDVGAAYGVPIHLAPLEKVANVCYFEPNAESAEELRRRNAAMGLTNARVFTEALSENDGPRTLYVTNVPTGSSLLKPGGPFTDDMSDADYFFPLREVVVQTRTMAAVLAEARIARVDSVKIDVQGTEYYVVKGMGPLLQDALCLEMEIGFPGGYLGQPGFAAVDPLMTEAGFALFDLRIAALHRKKNSVANYYPSQVFGVPYHSRSLTKRIAEADAVYFRRADVLIAGRNLTAIRRAMVLHCAYGFFIEALDLNDRALAAGLLDLTAHATIREAVRGWHHLTTDALFDKPFVDMILARITMLWYRFQGKLLGRQFTWWPN